MVHAGIILGFIALVIAFSACSGALFMLLWNLVAADVFHAPRLAFLHAWAMWTLIAIVGGAFRAVVDRMAK